MFDGEATPAGTEEFTADVAARTAPLYERVRSVIPDFEWPAFAPDIDAIQRLKRERNAIVLAHNYQTPEIFHCVADLVGDSLALAPRGGDDRGRRDRRCAACTSWPRRPSCSIPEKTVLIPDLRAGCSLADIDHRRRHPPAAPALSGRAGGDLRQHLGRGEGRIRHLLHLGQCREGGRGAGRRARASSCRTSIWPSTWPRRPRSRSSPGTGTARCTSGSPARRSSATGRASTISW